MPRYFADLNTVEAIKTRFRELAMQHHPDRGGDVATMQEINRQYHEALKACDGQQSDAKTYRYMEAVEQEIMNKLLELLKLRGLHIALIGYWIWVLGETRANKEALKAAGLCWHRERERWYYRPKDWRKSRKSTGSLGDLARKYGYKEFETADQEHMPTARNP